MFPWQNSKLSRTRPYRERSGDIFSVFSETLEALLAVLVVRLKGLVLSAPH